MSLQEGIKYKIVSVDSGKCLDGDLYKCNNNGTLIKIYHYVESEENQKWILEKNNDCYIIRNSSSGKVLDATDTKCSQNGCEVKLWDYLGNSNQQWFLDKTGDAYFIRCKRGNLGLDVEGARKSNGTKVLLWNIHGGTNQKWRFNPLESKSEQCIKVLVWEFLGFEGTYHTDVKFGNDKPTAFGPRGVRPYSIPGKHIHTITNYTNMTIGKFNSKKQNIISEWNKESYNLQSNNCNHFSDAVLRNFGFKGLPGCYFSRGDHLDKQIWNWVAKSCGLSPSDTQNIGKEWCEARDKMTDVINPSNWRF